VQKKELDALLVLERDEVPHPTFGRAEEKGLRHVVVLRWLKV
jgi:hypothetical protein